METSTIQNVINPNKHWTKREIFKQKQAKQDNSETSKSRKDQSIEANQKQSKESKRRKQLTNRETFKHRKCGKGLRLATPGLGQVYGFEQHKKIRAQYNSENSLQHIS